MKKIIALLLALVLVLALFAGCGGNTDTDAADTETATAAEEPAAEEETPAAEETAEEPAEEAEPEFEGADINIAVLAGPTGIGASALMAANEAGLTVNNYNFTVCSANDEIVAGITGGDFDIAAIATNLAANLYQKTSGGVEIIALNTLGVLYMVEAGNDIASMADLKGKTVYATGQGANPEYVLEYLLTVNGLTYTVNGEDTSADVNIVFDDGTNIVAGLADGSIDTAMLPIPNVVAAQMQNENVRIAIDLNEEWTNSGTDGVLTMGCIVVNTEFAESNPEAVDAFLSEYADSIEAVKADPASAGTYCETYGIVAKAAIATKVIPNCALVCITGADIQPSIEPYYQVLFDANPESVGGSMPDTELYYVG